MSYITTNRSFRTAVDSLVLYASDVILWMKHPARFIRLLHPVIENVLTKTLLFISNFYKFGAKLGSIQTHNTTDLTELENKDANVNISETRHLDNETNKNKFL